jgi:hypothetical protein
MTAVPYTRPGSGRRTVFPWRPTGAPLPVIMVMTVASTAARRPAKRSPPDPV